MGLLTDIIIADRSEAAAINAAGGAHLRTWIGLEGKGVDPAKLGPLWQVLSGEAVDHQYMATPLDQPSSEGPWVILVPEPLVAKLAVLEGPAVTAAAEAWSKTEECVSDRVRPADAEYYLGSLADTARQARAQSKDLLLWMSL